MKWLIFMAGLALAFFGSAGVAALVTDARSALAEAVARRLRGSDESLGWIADTERMVVAGIAVSSFGIALAGATLPGLFHRMTVPQFGLLLIFLAVPLVLLGGHLLPRWLTQPRAARVVAALRPPLGAVRTVLGVVMPGERHLHGEDVNALARQGAATGLGNGEELVMVGGVMTFAERPVREVMTPRTEVVAVAQDATLVEVLAAFTDSGYTRLPVYRENLDEIVGMVHAFDLFKLSPGDPVPLRQVTFAPESRASADLLLDMQRERKHFAVVLDEFGGTAGIVTLEDLLETLVGQISDEDEPTEPQVAGGTAILEIDGAATASEVAEHFGVPAPDGEAVTFAGLLAERAGRIPVPGERFRLGPFEVDVIEGSPARTDRLLVRRGPVHRITLDRDR